jgi:hypothetical protein
MINIQDVKQDQQNLYTKILIENDYTLIGKSLKKPLVSPMSPMDGELEIVKPEAKVSQIRTEDFLSLIQHSKQNSFEAFPDNCKFYFETDNSLVYVIQELPRMRTIHVDKSMSSELAQIEKEGKLKEYGLEHYNDEIPPFSFHLSFPYVIYFIALSKNGLRLRLFHLYFRPTPIKSVFDQVFIPPLLNIASRNNVCIGDSTDVIDDLINQNASVSEICQGLIQSFWTTYFNSDYIQSYEKYQNTHEVYNYFIWQYMSQIDPLFIYNVNWIPEQNTIYDNLRDVGYENGGAINLNFNKLYQKLTKNEEQHSYYVSYLQDVYVYDEVIREGALINIGDCLHIDGQDLYVVAAISNRQGHEEKRLIRLENESGDIFEYDVDQKEIRNLILEQLGNLKKQSTFVKNGIEIKHGDIIRFKEPIESLGRFDYIRPTRDGKLEMYFNGCFYLTDVIDFEKIDLDEELYSRMYSSKKVNYT